jgi:acyl-homoserine-lactone acylase
MKSRAALACLILAVAPACTQHAAHDARAARIGVADGAEILWDRYGVPHIFAADDTALLHAYGWAQMHSHGHLIAQLYAQARGRGAEYFGGQRMTESDMWVRVNDVPARARQWSAAQSPHIQALLAAFVRGMNDYAAAHPDALAPEHHAVLPLLPEDVLAHAQRVLHFTFIASPALVRGAQQSLQRGSNAWAVAPARSARGTALLLANPHLPWGDLFTWYEAQLVSPSLDVYGAGLVGMPLPSVAFSDSLGWTHTVNTYDGADLYRLTLRDEGYVFDGVVRPFEVRLDTVRVRQPDGALAAVPLTIRSSVHGPVIAETDAGAVALRVAGLDAPHVFEQYWDMLRARNLGEFEAALTRLQLPMFTIMYADVHGRIMHLFNGRVPRRGSGTWATWSGPVRGDTSATLWTEVHDYAALPRVVDPPTGWLQNANDPPWTTTVPLPLDPAAFPPYMAPAPSLSWRAIRSARLMHEHTGIDLDDMARLQDDAHLELALRAADEVIAAARAHGGEQARVAAAVLERWDRTVDAGSRGGVLFEEFTRQFMRLLDGRPMFVTPWSPADPLATPRGLADPPLAAQALEAAAAAVAQRWGSIEVQWGEVHRLRRDGVDLPAAGSSGAFRVLGYEPAPDGRLAAASGDGFIAVVEFDRPVRARALLTYGNASQQNSPHRTDQLPLYARKELRTVERLRGRIEVVRSERLR